jgi:glucose-6-phosphate-specific signal transduction histidine kinase
MLADSEALPTAPRLPPLLHCGCDRFARDGKVSFIECANQPGHTYLDHYCVPIRHGGRLHGVLSLYIQGRHRYDPEEVEFLQVAANILAVVFERKRLAETTERLLDDNRRLNRQLIGLQEAERRQIARELHDDVGQLCGAVRADIAVISKNVPADSAAYRSAAAIHDAVERMYTVTQAMFRRLRPGVLDDLGLAAAIQTLVSELPVSPPGLPCHLAIEGDLDTLGDEVSLAIFRLVQEGLTNILRHAVASQASVSVSRLSDVNVVVVQIEDDGCGMKAGGVPITTHGFGLLGMRERVEALGGWLDINSVPGLGLMLRATIPLAAGGDRE